MNHTVESVRANGCKVKVFHRRLYLQVRNLKNGIISPKDLDRVVVEPVLLPACCVDDVSKALPKGGCTTVQVTLPDGEVLTGWSECSVNDPYNRKRGVQIALNRAMMGV